MNIMLNTGKSGLLSYQYGLDVIAHNIANSDTMGYKSTRASFRDLIYSSMDINKNRGKEPLEQELTGRGVRALGQNLLYSQGVVTMSEYETDYAIEGDALFAVDYKGTAMYTRNGNFQISVEGDQSYLVTADGGYVLDWNMEKIIVPYKVVNVQNEDGIITQTVSDEVDLENLDPQIGMFTFSNPSGLMRRDSTRFLPTDVSGEAQTALLGQENQLLPRYLERSNVNLSDEMTNMIITQRAYQFNARVVTVADAVEDETNRLRG